MEPVERTLSTSFVHEEWESIYRTADNEAAWEMMFEWLGPMLGKGSVLDVGCGIGQHSLRLHRQGFSVTPADFSPNRVAAARANFERHGIPLRVAREDVTGLSFSDNAFDAALCWGVLMHVPGAERGIAELCRVVKPGGHVAVYENSARSVNSWILGAGARVKRLLGRGRTIKIERAPLGLESWCETDAGPLLIRRTFISALVREFQKNGCRLVAHRPGQFFELYRFFPDTRLARLVHAFNALWFRRVRLPYLSFGRILVFVPS